MSLATVADACELVTDGTHYTPKNIGQGVPFVTVKDLQAGGIDFRHSSRISQADFEVALAGNSAPQPGDVLFSKDGTVGKVHVVGHPDPFAVLSSIAILRPKAGVDSRYFGQMLRTPQLLEQAVRRKTGSGVPRIILSDLKKVKIPLPALEEQRRIAAILDRADELHEKRRQLLAMNSSLSTALFADMFRSESAQIPLGRIATIRGGKRLPKGVSYSPERTRHPYIRVVDLVDGLIESSNLRYIDEAVHSGISRYVVGAHDVIISIAGTIGSIASVPTSLVGANLTENAARIVPRAPRAYRAEWLAFALRTPELQAQIRSHIGQVTIGKLALFRIGQLEVSSPALDKQDLFLTRVAALRERSVRIKRVAAAEDELFKLLQTRAFEGEL